MKKEFALINEQLYHIEKRQEKQYKELKEIQDKLKKNKKSVEGQEKGTAKEPLQQLTTTQKKATPADKDTLKLYNKAYAQYKLKKYDVAIKGFLTIIQKNNNNDLKDNACYWLGEIFLEKKKLKKAISYFEITYKNYPAGNKAAHALYKIALIHKEKKEIDKSLLILNKIEDEYPDTNIYKSALSLRQSLLKGRK